MARDYARDRYPRGRSKKPERRFGSFGMFFVGILFGLVVAGFLYYRSARDTETRKFLSQRPNNNQVINQQIKIKGVSDTPKSQAQTTKPHTKTPKFDFYTVLPNDTSKAMDKEDDAVNKIEVKKPLTLKSQGISQTLAPPKPEAKKAKPVISDADVDGNVEPNKTSKPVAKPATKNSLLAQTTEPKKSDSNLPKKYYLYIASFNDSEEADQLKAQLLLLGFDVSIQKTTKQFTNWYRVRLGPYKKLFKAQQIQEQLKQSQIKSVLLQSSE